MRNIKTEVKGNNLVITIDITKDVGQSKSGKSQMVGSTGGFKAVDIGGGKSVNLSLNCTKDLVA